MLKTSFGITRRRDLALCQRQERASLVFGILSGSVYVWGPSLAFTWIEPLADELNEKTRTSFLDVHPANNTHNQDVSVLLPLNLAHISRAREHRVHRVRSRVVDVAIEPNGAIGARGVCALIHEHLQRGIE